MNQHPSDVWTHEPGDMKLPELCILARSMIAARRALHGPLPSAMIHDPALELLLALFVSHVTAEDVTEDGLVGRTTVGASVAGRWIKALEQAGLAVRTNGTVRLSDAGIASVTETLRAVSRSQWNMDIT